MKACRAEISAKQGEALWPAAQGWREGERPAMLGCQPRGRGALGGVLRVWVCNQRQVCPSANQPTLLIYHPARASNH